MKKNMKGITLVSLVITIIVMLILAGVSIQMATGDNGVLTRGQQGALKTKLASVLEELNNAVISMETDYEASYILESSMEATKSNYFTIGTVGGTVESVEKATSAFMTHHKGLNDYLNSCQILAKSSSGTVKNDGSTVTVNVPALSDSLTKIAGQNTPQKAWNSVANSNTNCGFDLTPLYLSNDTPDKVGGDLFVALYYVKKSIPTFVDVGIVEATGSTFKSGSSGVTKATSSAKTKITGCDSGVTWLNNAELDNN